MKKFLLILVILLYMATAAIAVLALPDSVASDPSLFALVKTDTSANSTVSVEKDRLSFSPGRGRDGKMYGFQPGSIYYYRDLFLVENISGKPLDVWYTLGEDLLELNRAGTFMMSVSDSEDEAWEPEEVITLEAEGQSGKVDFLFSIPPKHALKSYLCNITVHAAQSSSGQGSPPSTGGGGTDLSEPTEPEADFGETTGEPLAGGDVGTEPDQGPLLLLEEDIGEGPVEELALSPEEPGAAAKETGIELYNYWPLLLLLLLPFLWWLLYASSLLVLVPGKDGEYEIVARKFARRKDKKWHLNVQKQLDKYASKYGYIAVDFRGRFLKDASKAVYSGKIVVGSGSKRYALISRYRQTVWLDDIYKKGNRAVG